MRRLRVLVLGLLGLAGVWGCGDPEGAEEASKGALLAPPVGAGKADVGARVTDQGALAYGEAVAGEFTGDLEFHGYTLRAKAGAVVTLEVTQKGSSRNLDTSLFVYGPRNGAAGFGETARAFDDDAGWGRLSRISSLRLDEAGEYLIVVGTADGRGRGRYRLEARCESGECLPPEPVTPAEGACPEAFAARIEGCVADWEADGEFQGSTRDLVEACADPEVIAPTLDALCASAAPPADLCARSLDEVTREVLPACVEAVVNQRLDGACVFGATWRDVFTSGALVVLSREVLTAGSALSDAEVAQVIAAVGVSAWEPTTREEAFDAVDGGEIHRVQLWDASNRRAFTGLEYGAGENSYGALFEQGTTTFAARIQDGDLYGCTVTWGAERRDCASDAACAEGLRCVGVAPEIQRGRCIDLAAPAHPAQDTSCSAEAACPAGAGLQCVGAGEGGVGSCAPAWLTGSFEVSPEQAIPDRGEAQATVVAYGLASVDVEVRVDLWIDHPRTADLRVTLVNPIGAEVLVAEGVNARELWLDDAVVRGFSGDEPVNGVWTLRVVDGVSGQTGTLYRFGLTVTSRWD